MKEHKRDIIGLGMSEDIWQALSMFVKNENISNAVS